MASLKQPMIVYPQSITEQEASNSKGSYLPIFIVVGVISILAALICIVGQVCASHCFLRRRRRLQGQQELDWKADSETGSVHATDHKAESSGESKRNIQLIGNEKPSLNSMEHDEIAITKAGKVNPGGIETSVVITSELWH